MTKCPSFAIKLPATQGGCWQGGGGGRLVTLRFFQRTNCFGQVLSLEFLNFPCYPNQKNQSMIYPPEEEIFLIGGELKATILLSFFLVDG